MGLVERINSTDYSSDFEFQSDLTAVVNTLHDGHYYWQNCYASVLTTSSYMPIVALQNDDGETGVYLAPNLPLFAAQNGLEQSFTSAGYNLSRLAGTEITAIEGQSPWDYLDQVAGPASGNYQDPEQRLNFQFASLSAFYGGVGINAGRFTQTSSFDKDNITLSIKTTSGEEMDMVSPWLTSYGGKGGWSFQSGEELCVALSPVIMCDKRLTGDPSASTPLASSRVVDPAGPSLAAAAVAQTVPRLATRPRRPVHPCKSPIALLHRPLMTGQ